MKKFFLISFILFFSLTAIGQRGKNKSLQEEALDDIEVLSSKNHPYIELFHKAVREKMSGNYTEAKNLFNECLKEKQDDDAVYFGLAEIAKSENNSTAILENFKKAYDLDPENTVYLQELAYIYAERANFEEAELLFREMCAREPRNLDFIYGYSKVLIFNKKYEAAIEQLDNLQEQTGIVPELAIMKADLYTELKNTVKAEETLLTLKKEFPDDLEVLKSVISYYEQQGENNKAIDMIEELIDNDPNNGIAHFVLVNNYLEQNEVDKFIEIAPKVFSFKDVNVQQQLSILDQMSKHLALNHPKIIMATKMMYASFPENDLVLLNYGNSCEILKKSKEALAVYQKASKVNPNNFEVWLKLLNFESDYLEYEALYKDGMEAIDLFPTMPFTYYSAAEGALAINKPDEAIQLLAAGELYLLGNEIQSALYSMRKGEVYFHKKEYKKGIVAFEKALTTDADNPNIKINYAFCLAKANIAQDVAKELLEHIPDKNKSPNYYKAKAIVALNSNQIQEGIKSLKKGIDLLLNNAELYDLLGDLYYKNKASQRAIEAWEKAQTYESRNRVLSKKIKEVTYYAPKYN